MANFTDLQNSVFALETAVDGLIARHPDPSVPSVPETDLEQVRTAIDAATAKLNAAP